MLLIKKVLFGGVFFTLLKVDINHIVNIKYLVWNTILFE
jgi:hypothetical protein